MAETVIIAPLPVPLADGDAATREARLGQRPYFRFRLVSHCIPPSLPLLLEQGNIAPEDWDEFWSGTKAMVLKVERNEKICFYVLTCVLLLVWAVTHLRDSVVATSASALLPLIPILLALFALRLCLRWRKSLLEEIELYCKDGKEANMFHANGYGIECELHPNEIGVSCLHLYILPLDRPYTRFEVYNGMLTFPGWNSSYLASPTFHSSETAECASVPLEDWNNFSSEITRLYEPQRRLTSCAAKVLLVVLLMLPFVRPVLEMVGDEVPVLKMGDDVVVLLLLIVGFFALLLMSCIYLVYRYNHFLGAKLTLVHQLAMRLAPHGAYVEHRRVVNLYAWHGPYERHYVYLFPAIARNSQDSTHENADDA
jgi:hypothetical protein